MRVRRFGTWFFQRKCELLDFEIKQSGKNPARWEKKGARLYTVTNVIRYPELRSFFTNRLLNMITILGGFIFYVGIQEKLPILVHDTSQKSALLNGFLLRHFKRIEWVLRLKIASHRILFL